MMALLRARERVPHCVSAAVIDLADGAVLAATPEEAPTEAAAIAVRDLLRRAPDAPDDGVTAEVVVAAGDRLIVGVRGRRQPGLGLLLVCHADAILGLALAFARVAMGEVEQEV